MSSYNVKDLAEYMLRAKKENKPFVLFTGAGCSKSAGIPLASELVAEINEKYALDLKALSKKDRSDYGRCMSALTKDDRRELLQGYIQKAKINWAHIVQAILLEKGYIQRVLTFNFDNILSRSCGLLGLYPSTYDFTSANLDLLNLIIDPSIVHLHGQSHGFIQLNTDEETNRHAEQLSQFVASTLSQSPSIFIGYSGNADAFFPLLKEKFTDQKRLFWIGRSEKVPDNVNESLITPNNVAHYLHHEDSDRFFIELAQELGCFPPKAFEDPYGHLLDKLNPVLDFPAQLNTELDILASTRRMLKKSQSEAKRENRPNFELLLMEGKYNESINLAKELELKKEEKTLVAWAEIALGNQLLDRARQTRQPELFKQSFEKYQRALTIKPDSHEALNNWGNALSDLADLQQNPELFERSFEKYQRALAIKPKDHEALNNWGNALSELAELQQEPELFEQSIEK
ncbi:SIR2 family protein, partial [Vibrio nigripulchritudo]|uniref:SIR2 family protein n=1 Tax=Vibrio nigripulchritudo TaxID=28173 RepID=UPI0007E4FC8B